MMTLDSPHSRPDRVSYDRCAASPSVSSRSQPATPSALHPPQREISRISPWLMSILYPLGRRIVLPSYFSQITIVGQEHLPRTGPLILAPTHRSRWDGIMACCAAGHHVTGRHLRFMVTADEVIGLQAWFIRRTGGFAIDTRRPGVGSLRHGLELLHQQQMLVIFPEGNIYRDTVVRPLKPGLARLALQAEATQPGLGVRIVPMSFHYTPPVPTWRAKVHISIGAALNAADYLQGAPKQSAVKLTQDLHDRLSQLYSHAR